MKGLLLKEGDEFGLGFGLRVGEGGEAATEVRVFELQLDEFRRHYGVGGIVECVGITGRVGVGFGIGVGFRVGEVYLMMLVKKGCMEAVIACENIVVILGFVSRGCTIAGTAIVRESGDKGSIGVSASYIVVTVMAVFVVVTVVRQYG